MDLTVASVVASDASFVDHDVAKPVLTVLLTSVPTVVLRLSEHRGVKPQPV